MPYAGYNYCLILRKRHVGLNQTSKKHYLILAWSNKVRDCIFVFIRRWCCLLNIFFWSNACCIFFPHLIANFNISFKERIQGIKWLILLFVYFIFLISFIQSCNLIARFKFKIIVCQCCSLPQVGLKKKVKFKS